MSVKKKTMKFNIQIPTVQFGLIGAEIEGTPGDAVALHNELLEAYRGGAGIPQKEWNLALDAYLNGQGMTSDTYYALSLEQQKIIQELKKCFKRLKSKEVKMYTEDGEDEGNGPGKGENGDWSNQD